LRLLQQSFSGHGDLLGEFLVAGQGEPLLAGKNLFWEFSENVVAKA
jgi:hypothetical protein